MKKCHLILFGSVCAGLSVNVCAEEVSIEFSAVDNRVATLIGDSADRSATGHMYLQNSDSLCTRSSDSCSFQYRLTSQASADDGFFSSSDDKASFGGLVNFAVNLGSNALWDIQLNQYAKGTLAVNGAGPAVIDDVDETINQSGPFSPISGLSVTNSAKLIQGYSPLSYLFNAERITPSTFSFGINSNVSCASGGSYAGECIATLGEYSTLNAFDLDNSGVVDSSQHGLFVNVIATPHLNFTGQTLVGDVVIANGESLNGFGMVDGNVSGVIGSAIDAKAGVLTLGDANSTAGFAHQGSLSIANNSKLIIKDADAAELGAVTTISGGMLTAANGFLLDGTDAIQGYGMIVGELIGTDIDSRMTATGEYALTNTDLAIASDHMTLLSQNWVDISSMDIAGGQLRATGGVNLLAGGSVKGFGEIHGAVNGGGNSAIIADLGDLTLGDSNAFNGFRTQGNIDVGANNITLKSKQFATLGALTNLSGGTLNAANGLFLEGGNALVGSGSVNARIAAKTGSTIVAEGDLTLGDEQALDGYFSQGVLEVNNHSVTINDKNQAVLGSLNTLGNAVGDGVLQASNGMLLAEGYNLSGHGTVNGDFKNQGYVEGVGNLANDQIEFTGDVSGAGDYAGNVLFSGTFSPGNSPGEVAFESLTLGVDHVLTMEIAGLQTGTEYDVLKGVPGISQIQLAGTLAIDFLDGFMPATGDIFDLIIAESITGNFALFNFPIINKYLALNINILNDFNGTQDVLRLRVTSVPVPAAFWLFGSVLIGYSALSRRRKI